MNKLPWIRLANQISISPKISYCSANHDPNVCGTQWPPPWIPRRHKRGVWLDLKANRPVGYMTRDACLTHVIECLCLRVCLVCVHICKHFFSVGWGGDNSYEGTTRTVSIKKQISALPWCHSQGRWRKRCSKTPPFPDPLSGSLWKQGKNFFFSVICCYFLAN